MPKKVSPLSFFLQPSYSMVDMPFLSFRRVSLDGAETEEEEREAADRNQMSYKRKAR